MRFQLLGLLAGIWVVCCGCEGSSVSRFGSSTKPLPPEYRIVAKHLARGIYATLEEFQIEDAKSVEEVLAEGEEVVLDLTNIQSEDAELNHIAALGREACAQAIIGLKRVHALPQPPDAASLFVESAVHGYFGNLLGAYGLAVDAMDKQKALVVELEQLVTAVGHAESASYLLPKVAQRYAPSIEENSERILLDFEESWAGNAAYDWLVFYNNGLELTDCTILVELVGAAGERRKNFHFVERWPSGGYLYARYAHGMEVPALGKTIDRCTVASLKSLTVTLWSPSCACRTEYLYAGTEREKDIVDRCANLNLAGKYIPYQPGLIWTTQRGAELTLRGAPILPQCRLTLTFRETYFFMRWGIRSVGRWRRCRLGRFLVGSALRRRRCCGGYEGEGRESIV